MPKKGWFVALIACLFLGMVVGCAPRPTYTPSYSSTSNYSSQTSHYTPPKYDVTVTPPSTSISNNFFDATILPGDKGTYGLISDFILIVKNKTKEDLEIDWNKTLFIKDNQTRGGFMFAGIVYSKRNEPKVPDVVFPGVELKKAISPTILVFYDSGRYGSGWNHNELSGEVGVYLVTKVGKQEIKEKLIFKVVNKKIQ